MTIMMEIESITRNDTKILIDLSKV